MNESTSSPSRQKSLAILAFVYVLALGAAVRVLDAADLSLVAEVGSPGVMASGVAFVRDGAELRYLVERGTAAPSSCTAWTSPPARTPSSPTTTAAPRTHNGS